MDELGEPGFHPESNFESIPWTEHLFAAIRWTEGAAKLIREAMEIETIDDNLRGKAAAAVAWLQTASEEVAHAMQKLGQPGLKGDEIKWEQYAIVDETKAFVLKTQAAYLRIMLWHPETPKTYEALKAEVEKLISDNEEMVREFEARVKGPLKGPPKEPVVVVSQAPEKAREIRSLDKAIELADRQAAERRHRDPKWNTSHPCTISLLVEVLLVGIFRADQFYRGYDLPPGFADVIHFVTVRLEEYFGQEHFKELTLNQATALLREIALEHEAFRDWGESTPDLPIDIVTLASPRPMKRTFIDLAAVIQNAGVHLRNEWRKDNEDLKGPTALSS